MSKTVVVLCPNGRRQTVHTSPNASLLYILEEVCRKQNFIAEHHQLRHNKTILDLSSNVRFANLPNNCKLEMDKVAEMRQEGKVRIGLQLECGERLISEFSPSESLYEVISRWNERIRNDMENSRKEPIMIYLQREIVGVENLKSVNLRKLGLTSGNVALRLIFRDSGSTGHQAHVFKHLVSHKAKIPNDETKSMCAVDVAMQVQQPVQLPDQDVDTKIDSPISANISTITSINESSDQNLVSDNEIHLFENPDSMEVDDMEAQDAVQMKCNDEPQFCSVSVPTSQNSLRQEERIAEADIMIFGDNEAMLFNFEDIHPISHVDLPDDFYELDVSDVKYLVRDLKTKCQDMENRPLETEEMRQNQKMARLKKYKKCYVRIQFPDRMVLQGTFLPDDKILDICNFVKSFMVKDVETFYLFTTPPKSILNLDSSLYELNLVPTALLYFGSSKSKEHYLRSEILAKVSTITAVTRTAFCTRMPEKEGLVKDLMPLLPKRSGDGSASNSQMKKVPRWFKKQ